MKAAALIFVCASLCAQTQVDRYLTGIARSQWEARAARVAAIRTPAEVKERQQYIRKKLVEEIGGFPAKTPLNARITGTIEHDDYKVEKLIYESQPHYYVSANVFVPKGGKAPYPAVLGTAGHSLEGKSFELYQSVWVSLARRGFVVLAYDPPGQGERLEYLDPATGKSRLPGGGTGEHSMAGIQCLLTGTNIARYFIWDGIRAVDYLLARGDVDPKRIAVTGNSGGGTQSSYLAAFEPRLAAAAPSCYLTSWEKLWAGPGPQDAEQDFVHFLKDGLDFPDFLIAFAPKPIQMATATRDFFPIDGAKATYAEAQRVFGVMGAADRAGFFEFDDTHGWSKPRRQATYRWLVHWLQDRPDDGAEVELKLDKPADLLCTKTGQVATSLADAETVQSLNAALAQKLSDHRAGAGGRNIPALVKARLAITAARGTPAATVHDAAEQDGYRTEKVDIPAEPGITLAATAFVPAGRGGASMPARMPAVLWVNGDDAGARALVREGKIVLAVDPRGTGADAPTAGKVGGYGKPYQTFMRALLVGKTMAGMQTEDLLHAFDYLVSRPDVDTTRVELMGKGNSGVIALYAAALEPRIAKVTAQGAPQSYLAIARMKIHQDITDIVVPGVLHDFDLPDVVAAVGRRCVLQ
jgi:cephalosporin-C deacetylase-like acetyl esterase